MPDRGSANRSRSNRPTLLLGNCREQSPPVGAVRRRAHELRAAGETVVCGRAGEGGDDAGVERLDACAWVADTVLLLGSSISGVVPEDMGGGGNFE